MGAKGCSSFSECHSVLLQQKQSTTNIQLKWHSITRNDGTGGADPAVIEQTVQAFNAMIGEWGFFFTFNSLTDLDFTPYDGYYFITSESQANVMKQQIRAYDASICETLHVYSVGSLVLPIGEVCGYAYQPFYCGQGESLKIQDGVVLAVKCAGSNIESFSKLLIHEVGHW